MGRGATDSQSLALEASNFGLVAILPSKRQSWGFKAVKRERLTGVTFEQFRTLAKLAGWDADSLAEMFPQVTKGSMYSEPPLQFLRRVLKAEPSGAVVIPYQGLIDKFLSEVANQAVSGKLRLCRHCGSMIPRGRKGHGTIVRSGASLAPNCPGNDFSPLRPLALGDLVSMNRAQLVLAQGRPWKSTLRAMMVALALQLRTLHGA